MLNQLANKCDSISEWLRVVLDKVTGLDLSKVCMVAWGIWKQINSQFWSSSIKPPTDTVFSAMQTLYDWIDVKQFVHPTLENNCDLSSCQTWHAPPTTYLKCNINDVFF